VNKSHEINEVINIRDEKRFNTRKLIEAEQAVGNGKMVIKIPEWTVMCLKSCVDLFFRNKPILRFTAYKVIKPIRTNSTKMNTYLKR
jgi:hypothetical protein